MISHPMDYTSFFLRFVFIILNDVKFTFLVVYPPYSLLESFQFKLSSALDYTSFFKF